MNKVNHVTDDLGLKVVLPAHPRRIISLCPSLTETVCAVGATTQLQGVTRYCCHPEGIAQRRPVIGGALDINMAAIKSLNPDLILAVKEENNREVIASLSALYPVYVFDITTVQQGMALCEQIGILTGHGVEGARLRGQINQAWQKISVATAATPCAYLLWNHPLMGAGDNTFIHDVIATLGLTNILEHSTTRYPKVDHDLLSKAKIILLGSEPYAFSAEEYTSLAHAYQQSRIIRVDGEAFCWYGAHMLSSAGILNQLIHQINNESKR